MVDGLWIPHFVAGDRSDGFFELESGLSRATYIAEMTTRND